MECGIPAATEAHRQGSFLLTIMAGLSEMKRT